MTRATNARTMRTAALAAAMLVLCVPSEWAQHRGDKHGGGGAPQSAPAPHYSQPRGEGRNNSPQYRQAPRQESRPQFRPAPQSQSRQQFRPAPQPQGMYERNFGQRPQPGYSAPSARPAYPGSTYGRPGYNGAQQPYNGGTPQTFGERQPNNGAARQPYGGNQPYSNGGRQTFIGSQPNNGARQPYGGPHLQDWLSRNQNVPLQDQERMLRSDPSFKRLPQADQQRLTQQLRQVDRMPEQQRDRRLARNEMLERLSPEDRLSVNRSGRTWTSLPADRQALMRRAFQDLRNVPPDQRQTVLNSARYQGTFTPQERGILSDFLKVEPYEPPH